MESENQQSVMEQPQSEMTELQNKLEQYYQINRKLNNKIKHLEHQMSKYIKIVEKAQNIIRAVKSAGSFYDKEEAEIREAWARIDARTSISD